MPDFDSVYILDLLYLGVILLASLVVLFIPLSVLGTLTKPFSFKTFGIRKIRRWNNRTDTLANAFLWVSFLLCFGSLFFGLYGRWIVLAWLIFSWLCALSRAVRLPKAVKMARKLTVIFFLNVLFGLGVLSVTGLCNNGILWINASQFLQDMISHKAWDLFYFLHEPYLICWLFQFLLCVIPCFWLWGEFKYMRLENTFKGYSFFSYVMRQIFVTLIWFVCTVGVSPLIGWIYHIEMTPAAMQQEEEQTSQPDSASDQNSDQSEPSSEDGQQPVEEGSQDPFEDQTQDWTTEDVPEQDFVDESAQGEDQ